LRQAALTATVWRRFESSKVPEITFSFWSVKVLTTAMGEATSDYFVHRFNPEAAVLVVGFVFAAALVWQLRAPRYRTLTYWWAVVMVSVFGTMCADVVHVGFAVPYLVSSVGFALALGVIFVSWHRSEGTLSIHSIINSRRELFYWATVTATFALGTAVGDMSAITLHLGYFGSGLLFGAFITLPALGYRIFNLNAIGTFWTAYVLTRPLGASFADWFGVSHLRGGLNWGPGNVAIGFSCLIIVGVATMALRERPSGAGKPPGRH
jgi:uncharacterized membrane-anchored protein